MTSRREEERNEKIIRGLMKLPPNRRCINCNSLGPQYVCTNFWTFVCMTCSGIHREFTHRVKSVSMAKFTTQEVEALEKGGNQRAREIYLKDWDQQRQRLPDNSNVDKVRQFIRSVYVDKKYAEGNSTNKPPRDIQKFRGQEDETRRASSYHSYSQSPPYDFQYEERRYGKHAPVLTRKPGSDRGLYEGKFASLFSPSRLNDPTYEDRFANEGSIARASDYSASSGGDPFKSELQSPNFQKEFGSPSSETSRDILDTNAKKDIPRAPRPQRTASSGSFGSFDSSSLSFKSITSLDVTSEPEQNVENHHSKLHHFPTFPQSKSSGQCDGLDAFNLNFDSSQHPDTSAASTVTMPKFPDTSSSVSQSYSLPDFGLHHSLQTYPIPSADLSSNMTQQHTAPYGNPPDVITPGNERWATFDLPQRATSVDDESFPRLAAEFTTANSLDLFATVPQQQVAANSGVTSLDTFVKESEEWANFDLPQHMEPAATFPPAPAIASFSFEHSPHSGDIQIAPSEWSSAIPDRTYLSRGAQLHEVPDKLEGLQIAATPEPWSAFDDPTVQSHLQNVQKNSEGAYLHPLSVADQYLDLRGPEGLSRDMLHEKSSEILSMAGYANSRVDYLSSTSAMAGLHSHATDRKSTNPFDLPYDYDIESTNTFWDMSSLQAALPNVPAQSDDSKQPWLPQDPAVSYFPAHSQGAYGYMAVQSPSTQISNGPGQGPVASVGGNPFA